MSTHRDARIAQIEARRIELRKDAIESVKAIQATCSHEKVVQDDDRRICCVCGIEERSRYPWWPSDTVDGGYYEFIRPAGLRTILNTEFVKTGDLVALRVSV